MENIRIIKLIGILGLILILFTGHGSAYRVDGLMNIYNISEMVTGSCGPYWTVNSLEFDKSIITINENVNAVITYTLHDSCYSGNVIYSGVFGNWDPNNEIARLIDGSGYGSPRTESKSFTFKAPDASGSYSIRWYFDSTFWPLVSYYGWNSAGHERGSSAVQKDFIVQDGNNIGYSANVVTGQNTFVKSSDGSFGLLLKGGTKPSPTQSS